MKRYELGLARGYVSDWSVQEALREFIQNGIDQEKTIEGNTFSIDFDCAKEEIRLCNKKSVLNKSTLLLGCTSKADDDNAIGHFGEGYKLGCLVLLREGKEISIENYGAKETWNFSFAKLKKYDYVESLVVDIDKDFFWETAPNNDLTIVIKNFTAGDYEDYLQRTIKENADVIETSKGRILKDREYAGKIYVNGLFVADVNNFTYGYDIKPQYLKIGRDRNLLSDWDLSALTKSMWLESDSDEDIFSLLEEGTSDVNHLRLAYSYVPGETFVPERQNELADKYWANLKEKYGDDIIIADSESEREKMSHLYKKKRVISLDSTIASFVTQNSYAYKEEIDSYSQEDTEETLKDKIYSWGYENYVSASALRDLVELLKTAGVDMEVLCE